MKMILRKFAIFIKIVKRISRNNITNWMLLQILGLQIKILNKNLNINIALPSI